ncbi:MAG: M15 family metallopeptidase [Thermoleophilia bacterium]
MHARTLHRSAARRSRVRRMRVALLLLVVAAAGTALGHRRQDTPPGTTVWPGDARHGGALGEAGGEVPDGTTVFDDGVPGVANLDTGLLTALRRAAADAGADGVGMVVNSGWRSPRYQELLLREAVARYGSYEEAARWVATPATSAHVSGDAVDIGPSGAAEWLAVNGAAYGLCRVYGNEPWHFELRPGAAAGGCPPPYPDPSHDPRTGR